MSARHPDRIILDALVGHDPWLSTLYHNSAEFKMGADLLVRTLPRFMALMGEEARESEARRHAALERLRFEAPTEARL